MTDDVTIVPRVQLYDRWHDCTPRVQLYDTQRDCSTSSAVVLHTTWLYYLECSCIAHNVIVLPRVQLYCTQCDCSTSSAVALHTTWLYYLECSCITQCDCITSSAVALHTPQRSPVFCSPESQGARPLSSQPSESRRDRGIDYGVS